MQVKQALIKARELIADRNHWTQGASARDDRGAPVPYTDPDAMCWCSMGAIGKVVSEAEQTPVGVVIALRGGIKHLKSFTSFTSIASFNDNSTHTQVLEAFDKAIENAS